MKRGRNDGRVAMALVVCDSIYLHRKSFHYGWMESEGDVVRTPEIEHDIKSVTFLSIWHEEGLTAALNWARFSRPVDAISDERADELLAYFSEVDNDERID